MDRAQVHYELFVRRQPHSGWVLDMAGEDRAHLLETAELLIAEKRVVAARVSKETLDPETREFKTVTILTLGDPEPKRKRAPRESDAPLCVAPSDLYTVHARERIGRVLEAWLARQKATPFELLHRPDLVEKLDATGVELQHAIQKIAIPEAQHTGVTVHEVIRRFQGLVERAIERLLKDHRKGDLPDLSRESFPAAARRLAADPERFYLLGAGVAGALGKAGGWTAKVSRLLDLADAAPEEEPARSFALQVVEQPLSEILGSRVGLAELLGGDVDLGGTLAAITRMAGAEAVEALIAASPAVARVMPPLEGPAGRLAGWLQDPQFEGCRTALGLRVLAELKGPRRLRPSDAAGEIELLRALARALIAASGRLLPADDVQEAFAARSRMMVTSDFVQGLLGAVGTAFDEAEAMIGLAENVVGTANKRQAGRFLSAVLGGLRFESECRTGEAPAARLAKLAALQRELDRAALPDEDRAHLAARIGEVGGLVEADAKLVHALGSASAPLAQRVELLLRLAVGEAAPHGPAADRARAEALKLMRSPQARAELAASPAIARVKSLMARAEAA